MSRLFVIVIVMLAAAAVTAQTANPSQQQAPPQVPPAATAPPVPPPDTARQMQLDLDQMESLVNNMAAQVSFIRDTNMSILLNTNVQLWSVLIRDLRMQLQEQQRAPKPTGSSQRHGDTE